jgi:hypothetical protein
MHNPVLPKIYIILVNYNGWVDTIECLESISRINYSAYQVIVVDNQSTDASMSYIKKWAEGQLDVFVQESNPLRYLSFPPVEKPIPYLYCTQTEALHTDNATNALTPLVLIQAEENKGFAAGNNIGILYALRQKDFSFVWLLNNDTVIDQNALITLVQKAQNYSTDGIKAGIITSKLLYYHQPDIIQAVGGKYNKWFAVSKHIGSFQEDDGTFDVNEVNMHYPVGASMLVSKEFITEVGLMCEDYFLYYEEMDWSVRGMQKGYVSKYSYQSKVFHKEGASIGSGHTKLKSELSDIYSIKNRFKFARKFYPMYLSTVYVGLIPVVFNRIKRKQVTRLYRILKAIFNEVTR